MALTFDKPLLNPRKEFEARFKNIYTFSKFFDQLDIDRKKELITLHNSFLTGETLGEDSRESLLKIESILLQTAYLYVQKRLSLPPAQAIAKVRNGTI